MNVAVKQTRSYENLLLKQPMQKQPQDKKTNENTRQDIRQKLQEMSRQEKKKQAGMSLADQQKQYANSLSETRAKTKTTSNELKKLKYNFKGVSAQILRAKTSASAKQAAGSARREVVRLKRMRQSGAYDEDEIQSAIAHAQAMERVAKKKAMHLQQEEMVHVSDEAAPEDIGETLQRDMLEDALEKMQELEEMQQEMLEEAMGEEMEDLLSQMSELMEEVSPLDLTESMLMTVDTEMTPDEFKMLKIKHRTKENKEILEADLKYLKSMFERLEGQEGKASSGVPFSTGTSSMPAVSVNATPVMAASAMPSGEGAMIDVSL